MEADSQLSLALRVPGRNPTVIWEQPDGLFDKSGRYRVVKAFDGAVRWGDWELGWRQNRVPVGTTLTIKASNRPDIYGAFDSSDRFVAVMFSHMVERCLQPMDEEKETGHG